MRGVDVPSLGRGTPWLSLYSNHKTCFRRVCVILAFWISESKSWDQKDHFCTWMIVWLNWALYALCPSITSPDVSKTCVGMYARMQSLLWLLWGNLLSLIGSSESETSRGALGCHRRRRSTNACMKKQTEDEASPVAPRLQKTSGARLWLVAVKCFSTDTVITDLWSQHLPAQVDLSYTTRCTSVHSRQTSFIFYPNGAPSGGVPLVLPRSGMSPDTVTAAASTPSSSWQAPPVQRTMGKEIATASTHTGAWITRLHRLHRQPPRLRWECIMVEMRRSRGATIPPSVSRPHWKVQVRVVGLMGFRE